VNSLLAKVDIGTDFLIQPGKGIREIGTLGDIISVLLQNIYVLAGLVLFILLIVGGVIFIMGAGGDNPDQAKKGKQAITAALLGFIVIFCAYWIIRIIEILTGISIFKPNL
jgi:Zn-dependent protease with chaperone function